MINNHTCLVLHIFCLMIIFVHSTNNRLIDNLKRLVDTAIEKNYLDENSNDLLIEQLTRILEEEEGLRVDNQTIKHVDLVDGSGELMEDQDYPPFYANMSIITITIVSQLFFHRSKLITLLSPSVLSFFA